MKIGILSDTHGTFDEPLMNFFKDVDQLWHAGDFGSLELADRIARFKPLIGVYGNVDDHRLRVVYPQFNRFECEQVSVLMTHIGGYPTRYEPQARVEIQRLTPQIFISGHSHILKVVNDPKYNLLHINPGAAGFGYQRVRTAIRLEIDGTRIHSLEVFEIPPHKL